MIIGELLMLSTEAYSDQSHSGPFKVLKDFDIHEIAALVAALPVEKDSWRSKNGPDDVIKYLTDEGFIILLECKSYHLGCYGTIEVSGE